MPLLSEVTAPDAPISILSPFAESVVFTALWGRTLSYQQLSLSHLAGCDVPSIDVCNWQIQGNGQLFQRMTQFQQVYSAAAVESDSMLLFTSIIAQVTMLAFCRAAENSAKGETSSNGYIDDVTDHQFYVRTAVKEIARLSNSYIQFSIFKVGTSISFIREI